MPSIASEISREQRVVLRKCQDATRVPFRVTAREVSAAASRQRRTIRLVLPRERQARRRPGVPRRVLRAEQP